MSQFTILSRTFVGLLMILIGFLALLPGNVIGQDAQMRENAVKLQTEAEEIYSKNTPEARNEAFPKFTEALKLWEQIGDNEGQIKAFNRLNDISFYRSEYKDCIGFSSRLLTLAQKLGDKSLEGKVLGNMGHYHQLLGESRTGLEYLKKSIEILNGLGEKQRESIALTNIGLVYYDLGEIKWTIDYFQRSLALKRETKDRRGEGVVVNNLGFINDEGGNKRKALEFYGMALEIAVESKDQRTEGTILSNIGSSYQDLGELQKAYDYYQQSLTLRRQIGDKFGEAMVSQNIASLYNTLGDVENALEFLNKSLEIYRTNSLKREEASALSSIGVIFSKRGDRDKAIEYFQKALALQKTLENKKSYALILRNLGKDYLETGELQKSQEIFSEVLKTSQELNDVTSIADTHSQLAQTFVKLGNDIEAEVNFTKAAGLQREVGLENDLAETLFFYAKFEEKNRRRASALEKIEEALKIIEGARSSIISSKLRSSYLARQQKFYEFYLQLLISEHKSQPEKGFDKLALAVSESARARSLLDSLGEFRGDIRGQLPPEILEEARILRQTINNKESQRLDAVGQKSAKRVAELEKEITAVLRQYEEVQTKIRQSNPQFASLLDPAPLTLEQIQEQVLDRDTVLLEYFLGEQGSFLFFVTHNKLEIFELPSQTLVDVQIRKTLENLKARGESAGVESQEGRTARIRMADLNLEKNLTETSRMLLAPVIDKIQGKRLLVVASGILQYLPFAALTTSSGIKKGGYLIETNEIINLPSASIVPLLRQIRPTDATRKNQVSILADPVFSADDSRLKLIAKLDANDDSVKVMRDAKILSPARRSDFSRLRFSRIEAEAISELANSKERFVALDFAANLTAATSENTQKSGIIHFATHGIINSQFPELSGIVLSLVDEKGKPQEGFLRVHDVYNLRLETDLVVLSACETALGKEVKGEGIVGLTRGFMFAGAPLVAATLWRVEDQATADLMKRFYQRMMIEKMPPSAALRQAQTSMMKEKYSAEPFFWAGFTLQGDWR